MVREAFGVGPRDFSVQRLVEARELPFVLAIRVDDAEFCRRGHRRQTNATFDTAASVENPDMRRRPLATPVILAVAGDTEKSAELPPIEAVMRIEPSGRQ